MHELCCIYCAVVCHKQIICYDIIEMSLGTVIQQFCVIYIYIYFFPQSVIILCVVMQRIDVCFDDDDDDDDTKRILMSRIKY